MQTHTRPRHRHFVAVPLATLSLLMIAGFHHVSFARPSASVLATDQTVQSIAEGRSFSLPDGVSAVLLDPDSAVTILHAQEDALRLEHGSGLLESSSFLSIDAGYPVRVSLLSGSAYFVRDAASVSVTTLRGTLIATVSGQQWVVPVGYQLRVDTLGHIERLPVPDDWVLVQRARETIAMSSSSGTVLPFGYDSLRTIARLRDAAGLDASEQEQLAADLRAFLRPSERVFALPAIALSVLRPLPESCIRLWIDDVRSTAARDPLFTASLLHSFIPVLAPYFEDAGYPEQAELWREATENISIVLSPLLSGVALDQWVQDSALALQHAIVR